MSERKAFERILASLHEAAFDPARWSSASALIDDALRTHGSSMMCADGDTEVVGAKDRETNRITARTVENTEGPTLRGFVAEHTAPGTKVYTDESSSYHGMAFDHEAVNHSTGEYVRGMAHTNGIESFWSMLKRGYQGTFHHFSEKHLDRYVNEFAGRHNDREADTIDMMGNAAQGMVGKRVLYRDLVS